jgi:hypothetical protein
MKIVQASIIISLTWTTITSMIHQIINYFDSIISNGANIHVAKAAVSSTMLIATGKPFGKSQFTSKRILGDISS